MKIAAGNSPIDYAHERNIKTWPSVIFSKLCIISDTKIRVLIILITNFTHARVRKNASKRNEDAKYPQFPVFFYL